MKYALDTNIISYILRGQIDFNRFMEVFGEFEIAVPPYVYFEIWRGLISKSAEKQKEYFAKLMEFFPIGNMALDVWYKAAEIWARLRASESTIDDADILIAAYCAVNGYQLITNNTKHFEPIYEIKLENWTE